MNVNDLKKIFAMIDVNSDGLISKQEMESSADFNSQVNCNRKI